METSFEHRYFMTPPREIAYLRFILESYDGLCFLRTLDNRTGLIEFGWHSSRRNDAQNLLRALHNEVNLQSVAPPRDIKPL